MAETKSPGTIFILPSGSGTRGTQHADAGKVLPKVLGSTTRSAGSDRNPFINDRVLDVESVIDLKGGASRGSDDEKKRTVDIADNRVLSLEASDGTTLITRADKLRDDLSRLYPKKFTAGIDAADQIDLSALEDQEAAARGVGDWIWSTLSVLKLKPDGLVEAAKDKALELLKDKIGGEVEDLAYAGASWAGAKGLMWAIESQLEGEPGLYNWGTSAQLKVADRVEIDDAKLKKAAEEGTQLLVFIHGTASSTVGSFGSLREGEDEAAWDNLTREFGGHVYGFEHRTFSESPLENAIQLAKILPKGAKFSIVTHSRGGLVGDLLCIDDFTEDMINRFQRKPVLDESRETNNEEATNSEVGHGLKREESEESTKLREAITREEQQQLRTLRAILKEKQFTIQRYVRVACPASGTTLLSDNLDLFLSSMLSLVNFAVGLMPVVGTIGGATLSAFRRIVLEIAEKRIDPRLIPGIEAMLPGSPMTVLLAQAKRRDNIDMAIIAGDADGNSGGFLKRIAIMFTDWIMFDHFDNDFVVDTQSMRAGLARRNSTREFYAHGQEVSHIHYFQRTDTRRALLKWLNDDEPQALAEFSPIPTDFDLKLDEPFLSKDEELTEMGARDSLAADAPIIIYLPGIMGSHLEIRKEEESEGSGDRVWFDPFHLAAGGIDQISIKKENVRVEGLFQRYYGDLENYLSRDNEVISFAYDWRKSIAETADKLARLVEKKLIEIEDQPQRRVSILAHSMGGLVVRALIANHKKLWDSIATKHNGQFVMLGTPNNGSHQMVENLIGKGSSVRQLAMLDFHHNLQEIIQVISRFKGVQQLLPANGFIDTGLENLDEGHGIFNYWSVDDWNTIKDKNYDRWFSFANSNGLGPKEDEKEDGTPYENGELKKGLEEAAKLWKELNKQSDGAGLPHHTKISYVYGLDAHTPCGLSLDGDQLVLHGTTRGDGSVSWDSGKLAVLAENEREWYMPVPHSNLTNTQHYFGGIADLLRDGKTSQLEKKAPHTRSSATTSYQYDAGPVLQPGAEDLALSFFGGRPHRTPAPDETQILDVSVRAMDLRFAQQPILCGHYIGDSIAGAEWAIDHHLLGGALSQRERLGVYAGGVGTSTIVLNPQSGADKRRDSARGAIIVGMGEWSTISTGALISTVRDGVLQYLLHTSECLPGKDESEDSQDHNELAINSLLLGYNSTTHITVASSIEAIVKGVCEANQQYRYHRGKQPKRAIRKLEFIEFYMDTAVTAAYIVRELPHRLEAELKQMQARIVPKTELQFKEGMRDRLNASPSGKGYWSRMIVTDADQQDSDCGPHCYENKLVSPIPQQVLDAVKAQSRVLDEQPAESTSLEIKPPKLIKPPYAVAERIKYVYLSERARAEAINQQRQPGLIEALIKEAIKDSRYNREISHTLFQLMVPVEFKGSARQTERLLLILDGYTANLPWEMLQADEEPLAQKMAIVRQLVSTRFRKTVISSTNKSACVIGNPSTANFYRHFPHPGKTKFNANYSLASLSGAVSEAHAVSETLTNMNYEVEKLFPSKASDDPSYTAIDVFNVLFKKPYRILMIAAHGEVNIRGVDDRERTGVVLSDGVMLTAAEIGQMEVVPDLVFLNCCHLAKADASPDTAYNRLAYSVSRELIEMGVRCVIAAGWAVDDAAACTFSKTFFECFVEGSKSFGDAVLQARRRTYKLHSDLNTWGAYQAYGDPNYLLNANNEQDLSSSDWTPVAPQELDQRLIGMLVDSQHLGENGKPYAFKDLVDRIEKDLSRVPSEWVSKPATQYQLAQLYGSILPDGFEKAQAACQRSIFEQDQDKKVPIVALEFLGNLEARQAEVLSEKAEALLPDISKIRLSSKKQPEKDELIKSLEDRRKQHFTDATKLANSAIKRFRGLLDITQRMHNVLIGNEGGDADSVTNTERQALLGSALKRKAIIMCRDSEALGNDSLDEYSWDDIEKVLIESANAYKEGEGISFGYDFDPYACINHMQLSGVLGIEVKNSQQQIEKSQESSRRSFKKNLNFFPAVMVADAEVAAFLLKPYPKASDGKAGQETPKVLEQADLLINYFKDAVEGVPRTGREFNSVVQQLICLSTFLRKRADSITRSRRKGSETKTQIKNKSKVLEAVAIELKKL